MFALPSQEDKIGRFYGILFIFLAAPACASFSGYSYERVITISSSNVSTVNESTLTNFPILISTNNVAFSTTTASGGRLNSSGYDLIFSTMADCSFDLYWDTETAQVVGISTLTVWIQIPALTTTTSTSATFYMCYGNSAITTYQGKSALTWDSNYKMVYHLPNGHVLGGLDSTINKSSLTFTGPPTVSSGQIDGAAFFNGSSQYARVASTTSANITGAFTLSTWLYTQGAFTGNYTTLVGKEDSDNGYYFIYGNNVSNILACGVNAGASELDTTATVSASSWTYASCTLDGSNIKIYKNGTLLQSQSNSTLPNQATGVLSLAEDQAGQPAFHGNLDEARVSNIVRSADWIRTEFINQRLPSNFVSIGAEISSPVAPPVTSNFYGLFINGAKVLIRGGNVRIQ